jgi:3-oxoacyl-[acyl-carrier protein] reductase
METDWLGLRGQVVIVTGGASGIGKGIALAFGLAGARVVLTYLSSEEGATATVAAIEEGAGQALAMRANLAEDGAAEAVVAGTVDRFGGVDILVANAGGLVQRTSVADCSRELWDRVVTVNLTATFLCCRAVLPVMQKAGRGCIITISSLAAHNGGGLGAVHYAATKGGILTFTRGLAREVGPLGIRVNGIAPGLIATQFHDRFSTAEGRKLSVGNTPLGREGLPEDVAGAALFLASRQAAFLAGETIEVNGGLGVY